MDRKDKTLKDYVKNYGKFFGWNSENDVSDDLLCKIVPTIWDQKESENSFAFRNKETLMKFFNVEDKEKFDSAWEQISESESQETDGKRTNRLLILHSSALLALLFFYRVGKDNPITFGTQTYTKVFFEVKNKCIEGRNPSSVDVVLLTEDESRVLYIESKFTEPSHCGLQEIAEAYYKYYQVGGVFGEYFKNNGINVSEPNNDTFKIFIEGRTNKYLQGIKQMICHWIGVQKGQVPDQHKFEDTAQQDRELMTLAFGFDKLQVNYGKLYDNLVKYIEALPQNKKAKFKVKVLPMATYQALYSDNPNIITDNIAKFYNLKTK